MTTFVITAPDGKKYKVTGDTPEGAHAALMKMLGDQGPSPAATATDAPQYAPNGVPRTEADKAALISSAKAETLTIPQATVDRQKGIDALAEAWMLFDSANPGKADQYGMDKTKPPPAPGSTYTYKPDIPADIAAIKDPRQKAAEMQRRGYGSASFVVQDPRLGSGEAMVDALANGATLGWGDELASGLLSIGSERPYGEILKEMEDRRNLGAELYPGASTFGNLGGGLVAPGLGAAKLVSKAPGLISKILAGAAGGATVGGVTASGNATPGERMSAVPGGMILGGLLGGGVTGLASGIGALANSVATKSNVARAAAGSQTVDELKSAAGRMYSDMERSGVVLPQSKFPADEILADMAGIDKTKLAGKSATPKAEALYDDLIDVFAGNRFKDGIPLSALQQLRRNFGEVSADVSPGMFPRATPDAKAATGGIGKIDDVIDDLVGGANKEASATWKRAINTGKLQDVMEGAEGYLSGFTSGVRNKLKSILKDKRSQRGFSKAELDAMRQIVKGGPMEQAVRLGSSGLAKILAAGGGYGTGGIPGMAAAYVATKGATDLADSMTRGNLEALIRAVSTGKLQSTTGIPQGLLDLISSRLGTSTVATTTPGLLAQ